MFALQQDRRQAAADDFPQKLGRDARLLRRRPARGSPLPPPGRDAAGPPGAARCRGCWAPRTQSAIWAGELGLRYAFADFINPKGADIARIYRERFTPARDLKAPRTAVAVWALAAPTDEEAQFLASSSRMSVHAAAPRQADRRSRRPRRRSEFLAREARLTPSGDIPGRRGVVGSPETVRAGIETVAGAYQADEVIVVTITYDHGVRRRSYELIAEAFDLEPRAAAAQTA